jgi:hypothetical protein
MTRSILARSALGAVAFVAGAAFWSATASAQPVGAWCLTESSKKGGSGFIDCQWATFERCRAEAQIKRGHCSPNPEYRGPRKKKKPS